jgi:hypothetical protein
VVSLLNLLFTVINTAYPQINGGYGFFGSSSISWPVATLVIFSPIFILLMWLMEKSYKAEPERKGMGIHKWLTYITLFVSGLTMAVDLITVLYYFIDGQEVTTGFLLKILVVLLLAAAVFAYYISDITNRLTSKSRVAWRVVAGVVVLGSIILGFAALGSPRTQRLYKYDEQKTNDLMNLKNEVDSYYTQQSKLPADLTELGSANYYSAGVLDPQTSKPYEYHKTGNLTYEVCAEFNKDSREATSPNIYARPMGYPSWTHPAGHYCFKETVNPNMLKQNMVPAPKY